MENIPVDFGCNETVDFSFFDAVASGIVIRNLKGETLFVNQSFCRLFNVSKEAVKGLKSYRPYITISTETGEDYIDYKDYSAYKAGVTGKSDETCLKIQTEEGKVKWIKVKTELTLLDHNKYIVSTIMDITEEKLAKERCITSEQRLKYLIQSMDELIFTIDRNLRYTSVYGRWLKKYGHSETTIVGKSVNEIVDVSGNPLHTKAMKQAFSGKSFTYECQLQFAGKLSDFHVSFSPIRSEDGEIESILGVARDITCENRMKRQLKLSQDLYEKLIELSPEMIYLQMNGSIVYMNDAGIKALKANGMSELKGKSIYQIIHPEYHEIIKKRLSQLKQNKDVGLLEEKLICFDGSIKYFEVSSSPIKMGRRSGSIVFARDVTVKRQAVELLKESEEKFRQLAENINDIFWMKDIATNKFIYISPALDKLAGPLQHKKYPNASSPLQHLILEEGQKTHGNTEDLTRSYKIKTNMGKEKWMKERIFYIHNEKNEPIRIAGVAEDITILMETQELLQKQKRLMIIQNLAAGIAHEIRNPLTTIKGFMQLLQNFIPENYFNIMESEVNNIDKFIDQMLLLGKDTAKKEKRDVAMYSLLSDVISAFQPKMDINFERGNLKETDLVQCHADELKEVLFNILDNACSSFSGNENREIWLKAEVNGNNALITIKDNGKGISAERIKMLGEPYYANNEKGIGFGLMICQKIIENHHGELTILSKKGEGTTVKVQLPLKTALNLSNSI
ncbi:PAS domain-containing protein [Bacillus massilinigeriensis]|uniref:PAS domain-containing protein n=1 Tax=Bacillus mediterraneensis TaxID=1805474 RepID=UPI0008F9517A|nr:PAS domain-containing sensor histidine kinase [Bacillus mediterraneensis]